MASASLAPRLCLHCGAEFTSKLPTSKYCGRPCWLGAEYERRKARRAAEAVLSLARRDPVTGKMRPTLPMRQCDNCGKDYRPKDRRSRYCSRDCTFAHPGWRAKAGQAMRLGHARAAEMAGTLPTCKTCGCRLPHRRWVYCLPCREVYRRDYQDRVNASKRKPSVERTCLSCGKGFWSGWSRRKYCSVTCARREDRACRRARKMGRSAVAIASWQVFVRDNWKCHLCRRTTPASLMGTLAPNAPTIDHVVPLARGGDHTMANVRCACRDCNSRKSDNNGGQASLF